MTTVCFDSLFSTLVLQSPPLAMTVARRHGELPQSFFYTKPCPSPNVPLENIWAIKIYQAEVG